MKQLFVSLFFFLFNLGNVSAQHLDTSLYVVLKEAWIVKSEFPGCAKSTLSENEIDRTEQILKKCIEKYNINQEKEYNRVYQINSEVKREYFIIDLRKYKRQFVVVTNAKGEKLIWVNCVCGDWPGWRAEGVFVKDGGNCFFNVKINLTTNRYFDFMVNGDA